MNFSDKIKWQYKQFTKSDAAAKMKQGWDENPYAVIAVATGAVYAASKLISAVSASRNSRAWKKEVNRRVKTVK
jgi:hypothetical protein